jgi:hypothetical protein
MKFSDFKDLSIVEFLQFQGMKPAKKTAEYYQYFAPGRDENSPSLTVYRKKNDWYDFGTSKGGDIGKLIQYLYNCDPAKALSILNEYSNKNFISPCLPFKHTTEPEPEPGESTFDVIEIKDISHWQLKNYLKERKISIELAKLYVKEVHYNTAKGTRLHSLAFRNDKGGYVLRHKGQDKPHNTRPAYFTTIEVPGSNRLNLFEGFFDFLSALEYYRVTNPAQTTIVLNSLSNLHYVIPLLSNYEKINLYLDNDTPGQDAADKIRALHPCTANKAKFLYPFFKDFNEFLLSI